ncbi:MAG: GDYXXLXY domain-containing protein [Candidatus Pacearchaeota archaeon]
MEKKVNKKHKIMKKQVRLIIFLALLIIGISLFIFYLSWPLMTGKIVVLSTHPLDPFDVFRGQYISINYDISTIPQSPEITDCIESNCIISQKIIYVALKENTSSGTYDYYSSSFSIPSSGVFIKGRIKDSNYDSVNVEYGIEQYFFERNKEITLNGLQVEVKIDNSGQARITRLLKEGKLVI